jgi:hypothetical protein
VGLECDELADADGLGGAIAIEAVRARPDVEERSWAMCGSEWLARLGSRLVPLGPRPTSQPLSTRPDPGGRENA